MNTSDPSGWHSLRDSKIHLTKCKVNTGAGCNILPVHRVKELFGKEWLETLNPPKVQIEAYGGQSVHSLGSCVLHLHIENKAFPTIFEVTDTSGPIILGRSQAKAMGYVQFPQIMKPHAFKMFTATLKKVHTKVTHTPETPQDCKSKTVRGTRPQG